MGKLVDLVLHPDELAAALQYKYMRKPLYPRNPSKESADLRRCYELLNYTSRSFAAVIQELHPELRDAVMLFYVILRALDTIEDDTGLAKEKKLPLLRGFRDILDREDWTFHESSETEKDRIVLQEFDKVAREFHKLKPEYQAIIAEITYKMGNGMADYIEIADQKNYEGVKTIADYDLYCHHVAGIVGEGLTRLAVLSGFGTKVLDEKPQLYNSMGLFLQKTNIIRDYREDLDDGRSFWPREVWGKYTEQLAAFKDPKNETAGLHCVSDLVVLSLQHVRDCLEYLDNITEPTLFSFCAIPQVMSIATLELVFNNPDIFQRNVKIRRGLSAKLILESSSMDGVYRVFRDYTAQIHRKNRATDPNFLRIELECGAIEAYINEHDPSSPQAAQKKAMAAAASGNDDNLNLKLLLAGGSALAFTCGLMVLAAWLMGARFDFVFDDGVAYVNRLIFDIGPGTTSRAASAVHKATQAVSSVAHSAVSTASSVAKEAHPDL